MQLKQNPSFKYVSPLENTFKILSHYLIEFSTKSINNKRITILDKYKLLLQSDIINF